MSSSPTRPSCAGPTETASPSSSTSPPPTGARENRLLTRAIIDASGTWATPSPAGASGLPAFGENAAADRITYRVPDLNDPTVRSRYAGKRTAVIGSGASAFTALATLADLAQNEPGTHAVWIRSAAPGDVALHVSVSAGLSSLLQNLHRQN